MFGRVCLDGFAAITQYEGAGVEFRQLRTVIDSGLARIASFEPRRGINTLHVKKISRAAAEQRAGRAGRTAPGRAFRLWSEADHARRAEFEYRPCGPAGFRSHRTARRRAG